MNTQKFFLVASACLFVGMMAVLVMVAANRGNTAPPYITTTDTETSSQRGLSANPWIDVGAADPVYTDAVSLPAVSALAEAGIFPSSEPEGFRASVEADGDQLVFRLHPKSPTSRLKGVTVPVGKFETTDLRDVKQKLLTSVPKIADAIRKART